MNSIDSFCIKYLEKFENIPFKVKFQNNEEYMIGSGVPKFQINIKSEIGKSELYKNTSLALGEAYMRGDIEITGDLFYVLNQFFSEIDKITPDTKSFKKLIFNAHLSKNKNNDIRANYDIGNNFYRLWLDDTMTHSCGYYTLESDSLHDAQLNKIHHTLKKLNIKDGMSLLDIGCGWGSLLIEAAKKYKIHGLGITISNEQFRYFSRRIKKEKLNDLLEVKLMNYRKLIKSGRSFDRVVSLGMIEHIGRDHYDLFIKNVNAILKQEGIFLLHHVSALKEYPPNPWIKKYIFKGAVVPSLREIINVCGNYKFNIIDVESFRRHSVKTYIYWIENYVKNKDEIIKMFNEEFYRMWELYLTSCAAAFNNGIIDVHQILITKGLNNHIPMTRDYMYK